MDSKNTKYDDVTLMQYADGELDSSERLSLEKDLINNKKLQDRLAVFSLTRDDLVNIKMKLPKHIEDLIDEQVEQVEQSNDKNIIRFPNAKIITSTATAKPDNFIVNFFKNYPAQSLAASVMFGLLIGSQGMKSLYNSPYNDILINNPINEYQSVVKPIASSSQTTQPFTIALPSRSINKLDMMTVKLLKALKEDVSHIPASSSNKAISIIAEFKNTQGYQCRLAQSDKIYIVACKNKFGNWMIHKSK